LKEDGVSVLKIEDSISKLRDINAQLQKLTLEFEKFAEQFDELKKEALLIVPPNSPKQKNFITDGGDAFKVFSNGNVVATFKYSSDKQKRKAGRLSQRKLNSL
jgi:VanZ family protein